MLLVVLVMTFAHIRRVGWSRQSSAESCQTELIGSHLSLNLLVGKPGFEPGTSSSQTKRATKLRHSPYQYMPTAERCRADATSLSLFEHEARVTRDFAQLVAKTWQTNVSAPHNRHF